CAPGYNAGRVDSFASGCERGDAHKLSPRHRFCVMRCRPTKRGYPMPKPQTPQPQPDLPPFPEPKQPLPGPDEIPDSEPAGPPIDAPSPKPGDPVQSRWNLKGRDFGNTVRASVPDQPPDKPEPPPR